MASDELQMVIDMLRAQPLPRGASFAEQRAALDGLAGIAPRPDGVAFEPLTVAGRPAEWVTAAGTRTDRALLYLHGGGYCIGSITSHRGLAAALSRAAGLRVLLLDYRLAPEHPFPAGLDDAVAAYRFLLDEIGDPRRLAIAGDSAGGGLTAATLLALRDAALPQPAVAALLSPWLDLSLSGASMQSRAAADPMVQRESLQPMADAYLQGAAPTTPLASPLFADLHDLAPMLIHVGDAETLLDDATRFADRARAAGVDATLEVWEHMIHVWHAFAFILPEARDAIARVGTFMRERLS